MYVRLVPIKLKPGVARDDPRVKVWQPLFAALEQECGGIVRLESGWNTTDRPIARDCGIDKGFATRAGPDAYGPHPTHQDLAAKLRHFADWVICDYEPGEWVSN